jgi:hypothetical protein
MGDRMMTLDIRLSAEDSAAHHFPCLGIGIGDRFDG